MELRSHSVILLLTVLLHCGQAQVNVNVNVDVKVNVKVKPKAKVRVQPAGHVSIGDRVTFTCDVKSGDVWNYEWFKDNKPLSDAQRTKEYEISAVDESHMGDYSCRGTQLTKQRYSGTSDAVTLSVGRPKAKVRVQPAELVSIGDRVTLTCDVESGDMWNYEWFKDNKPFSDGQGKKEYEISAIDESHTGVYSCRGTQSTQPLYSETSDAVTLTVVVRPKAKVRVQPTERVSIGDRVTLTCDVESGDVWNYEWFKDNKSLGDAQRKKEYEISAVDESHTGVYNCRGTQSIQPLYSETSDAVTLTVGELKPKPTARVEPQSTVYTGDTVTLICELQTALTGWRFVWFKGNSSEHQTAVAGGTNRVSLTVSNQGREEYKCIALWGEKYISHYSDTVKITVRGASFSVLRLLSSLMAVCPYLLVSIILGIKCYRARAKPDEIITSVRPKPTLRLEPQSTVYTGDTVTLICELQKTVTGSQKFHWFKGPTLMTLVKLKDVVGDRVSVTVSNTGTEEYQCVAKDGQDYVSHYSDPVKITVRVRPKAKVRVQPAERVSIGDRVTLTCDVESGGVWNYEWFKDNTPLSDAQRKKEYEISAVDESHTGVYSCRGTQSTQPRYSETSDAVTLTVGASFSILSLLSSLMAVCPYLLVSIIRGMKCYRARAKPDEIIR
ncbi:immunoglobulin superfamily member 1-like [Hoplias malabaricus]|uniref:immunoglobulin superfamily member 1-like n=1 Tax=Hoplias malabaricus TaxID=27720 RepID=UPI003461AA02